MLSAPFAPEVEEFTVQTPGESFKLQAQRWQDPRMMMNFDTKDDHVS